MAYDIFMDGFEYPQLRWDNVSSMVVSTKGRTGECVCGFASQSGCDRMFPNSQCMVVACAVKVGQLPSISSPLIIFLDGTTIQTYIAIAPNGALEFYCGTELIHTSQNKLKLGDWNFIEAGVRISSDSGSFEVRVNESSVDWLPFQICNTQQSANPWVNKVSLLYIDPGFNSATLFFDDLHITFGDELKYFGDCQVSQLTPEADGDVDEWTGFDDDSIDNYKQVLGLTGAIDSQTDNAVSIFQMSNLGLVPKEIFGVQVSAISHNSRPSYRELSFVAKSNGITSSNRLFPWASGDKFYYRTYLTDPGTGEPWTRDAVNNMQAGVRVVIG